MSETVRKRTGNLRIIVMVLLPIVLLGIILATSGSLGLTGRYATEDLAIERLVLQRSAIIVDVRNVGPIDATVEQVFVNELIRSFLPEPSPPLQRLATLRITIPFQWVEGETYTVKLLTSPSNLEFSKTIPIATLTPEPNANTVLSLARVGFIVGVAPVFLGLLWFPLLRRIGPRWMDYLLGFTIGLLIFLAIDSLVEAADAAGNVPRTFNGFGLITAGLAGTFLGLAAVNDRALLLKKEKDKSLLFTIAYLVAIGIGLHNLGEGLAIGGAFALGAIALGTRLVIGFTIHNTTEGLAIASPIIREKPSITTLGSMGLIAGVPTIFGAWIGGFVQLDVLAVLFLSVGAGAMLEVVYEITRQVRSGLRNLHGYSGIITGLLAMYATALLVG